MIKLKRVYDPPAANDGTRILVERLWPRGLGKEQAGVDAWLKDVAPSHALRTWYGHDPAKWDEFTTRYTTELHGKAAIIDRLREAASRGMVTLVFASKDERHCSAVILKDVVDRA